MSAWRRRALDRLIRYPRVWAELLALSWRCRPGLSTAALISRVVSVVTFAAIGLALRAVIDASQHRVLDAALIGAVGAAAAYATDWVIATIGLNLRLQALERVGLTEVDTAIIRDITSLETLDHLEQPDYLDRVTALRGAGWGIMDSAWAAVESVLNILRLALSLALLGTISPWLLLLLLFAAAPIWFDSRGRRAVTAAQIATAESLRIHRHLYTLCTAAGPGKEVRVTNAAPALIARQAEAWDTAHAAKFRAQLNSAAWQCAGWVVFTAGFAAALGLVVLRAAHHQDTLGNVVLAIVVATNLRAAVHAAVARSSDAAGYGRLLEPYLWLREYAAKNRPRPAGQQPPSDRIHGIDLVNVSFGYPGATRPAVANVSVTIPPGAVVAVVGEYGSGKTTLVKLLCKFHRPDSGMITVNGIDLAELDTENWRNRISTAFQDFGRYQTVLHEAVGLGDLPWMADPGRVNAALESADALDLVARLPDGADTLLGNEFGGIDLSEGQWQKVALARFGMREEPLLLILDEPTASLDAPSEHAIFDRYMTRARSMAAQTGTITVVVSHRFSTVAGADLILVMSDGKLIEVGGHHQLLGSDGEYAKMYEIARSSYLRA